MSVFFYILATIIALQHVFLIIGLGKLGLIKNNLVSVGISLIMIGANILAMAFQSWPILVMSFTFYCTAVFIELVYNGIAHKTSTSLQIPANLLMIIGSLFAFLTENWLFFGISYVVYWVLILLIARKRTNGQIQSQKI
ncbi:MAG: hypothetical protein R3B93_17615 [Bacteroidia bacterium]